MKMYRCQICGTFYWKWELDNMMYSPCCHAVLESVSSDDIPDVEA